MDFEELKAVAQEQCEQIEQSHVFMGICSENYADDPVCLMQLGLAILLDKPLFLLFAKGYKPPKNLIRMLAGYEFCTNDIESIRSACEKLKTKIEKYVRDNQ